MSEKITLTDASGEDDLEVFIIEETTINEKHYVLASNIDPDSDDSDDDAEGEAYILREDECEDDPENFIFTTVDDEEEQKLVAGIFRELLEDTEVTIE